MAGPKLLPYRVESNPVESRIRGLASGEPVRNAAVALFEITSTLSRIQLERRSKPEPVKKDSHPDTLVSMYSPDALKKPFGRDAVTASVRADEGAVVDASGPLARGSEVSVEKEERGFQREQPSEHRQVETVNETFESEKPVTGASTDDVVRKTEPVAERRVFEPRSPEKLADFLKQRAQLLVRKNAGFAQMFQQERLLQTFFQASSKELRERIEQATEVPKQEIELIKSVSVDDIVPGETFAYELVLKNPSESTIRSVILYDEFPVGLWFENTYDGSLVHADGTESVFSSESQELISFLTPNEWEDGKIAWHVPGQLRPGETVKLRFLATWYWEYGETGPTPASIHREPDDQSEVVGQATRGDLVFVADKRTESAEYVKVSVRQQGSGNRLEGFLPLKAFAPHTEITDADRESLLCRTIYSGYCGAEGNQPPPMGP